jgi:hypothetical protein
MGRFFREHKEKKEINKPKEFVCGRKGGTHYNQVLSDCESRQLASCTISAGYLYSLLYRVFKTYITY